ncbi:Protease 1 precursor [Porphyromonas macacae]|uniref:Protease 1 n=2 Tax=Porphyromonas macacae TaxID=28115 RepID=A0A379DFJ0_9PORP|nr:Protease 1 precursor [Porphyromonas macacae]
MSFRGFMNIQRMRLNYLSCFLCIILLHSISASGQFSLGGAPLSYSVSGAEVRASGIQRETFKLPPVNEAAIVALEETYNKPNMRVFPFAVTRKVNLTGHNAGAIYRTPDGETYWRLRIHSSGAHSLGLRLENFFIPEGGKVFLYNDKGQVRGAFTDEHNNPYKTLNTAPLEGDAITIEYNFPAQKTNASVRDIPFTVTEIYHDYKGIGVIYKNLRQTESSHFQGEPWYNTGWRQLTCAPNVAAFPKVKNQARSVVLMIVNGNSVCTGALINNTKNDGTPYVLTASHCLNGSFSHPNDKAFRDASARSTVFFFGFQSPVPEMSIRATEELSLSGSEIIAFNESSDLCLLRITGLPGASSQKPGTIPAYYNAYFSGWNRSLTPQGTFMGIHHPMSNLKRYNQTDDKLRLGNFSAGTISWFGHHWLIDRWDLGTTAGGSSGSPLYDKDGLIIGALTGGSSTCNSPSNDAYYAIATTWSPSADAGSQDMILGPWLDPVNSGTAQCPGYDPLAKHPVQRHSHIIKNIYGTIIESTPKTNRPEGVGNLIDIPANSRVLGFYFVMAPTKDFYENNYPKTVLALASDAKGTEAKELFNILLGQPGYNAYDKKDDDFKDFVRFVHKDTIEWFVPVITDKGSGYDLPGGGTYRVSLASARKGQPLGIAPMRLPNGMSTRHNALHLKADGKWLMADQDTDPYSGSYWIDVVTQPIHPVSDNQPEPATKEPVLIQSDGHRLVITITDTAQMNHLKALGTVELYHMSGMRVINRNLTSLRTYLDLGGIVPPGVYVARVVFKEKSYTEKVSLVF